MFKTKKVIVYPIILLLVFIFTLAFIPHYSCACGGEGNQRHNGSMLRHYAIKTLENIADAIRPIFN
jgi:hypothetical protein